jgi:hypothetical protein
MGYEQFQPPSSNLNANNSKKIKIENDDLGWQKTTYKFKKVVSEEILRRVRRYSSANKDIPFKTPLFIYSDSVTTPFVFITATLNQHENTGNNDQLVK